MTKTGLYFLLASVFVLVTATACDSPSEDEDTGEPGPEVTAEQEEGMCSDLDVSNHLKA